MNRRRPGQSGDDNEKPGWKIASALPDIPSIPEDYLPEALAALSTLLGWLSLTVGAYILLLHPAVWFISGGLLLFTCVGWRPLRAWMMDGAYGAYIQAIADDEEEAGAVG